MTIPTHEEILDYVKAIKEPVSKRSLIKAFGIGGEERRQFKAILSQLEKSGQLKREPGQVYNIPDGLPAVMIVEIVKITSDGDVIAHPVNENVDTPETSVNAQEVHMLHDTKKGKSLAIGDRALTRLSRNGDGGYVGRVIKKIERTASVDIMGVVIRQAKNFVLRPTSKKARFDYEIFDTDMKGAKDGDIVMAEVLSSHTVRHKRVKVTQIMGTENDPSAISLISMSEKDLRVEFPADAIAQAKGLVVPPVGKREDLRTIPLVTIDGADARDFDDAVFTEPDGNGGFHMIVAIADVAHYVKAGKAIDKEAWTRGNSTYFPDRVLPMLPEELSNDLCSLMPKVERACLAVHMWIDEEGQLQRQKFVRGLMKSHARLTYEQVQAAQDGLVDESTEPLMQDVIKPLYEAYTILSKARQKRGALDLDMPERQIMINKKGVMTGVQPRERLDSHKLIEEFMVLANVAAATALEEKQAPCMYRIHDRPSAEKLDRSRDFLASFDLSLPSGIAKPAQLNQLLMKAKGHEYSHLISQMILRTQSQAVYSPENIGHFGLALQKYAHFTSPIRRYADLIVHRSLIRAYGLGDGGIDDGDIARISETAEHISTTERTSAEAERSSVDRFTASYLESRIGAQFTGVISGVAKFGLFVRLSETGADGLIPVRTMPKDFYVHDEEEHALIGRKGRRVFRLGAPVNVIIKEADMMTGSSIFELVGHENGAEIPGFKSKRKRGKPSGKSSYKDKQRGQKKFGANKKFGAPSGGGFDGTSSGNFKRSTKAKPKRGR